MPKVSSKSKTAYIKEPHFNSKIDMDDLEVMVTGNLTGEPIDEIAEQTNTTLGTVRRKLREIELPSWYPEPADVSQTIKDLYEVVVLKALHRLALNGIEMMELKSLPVALGIATDKLQMLNGQPTSMSLQIHTKVSREDLEARYKQMKEPKSQVVDAQVIEENKTNL